MNCQCDTHLYADKEKKKEMLADLVTKKATLARLPAYQKNREKETSAKDFNKPRKCIGHEEGCPCYENREGS